MVIYSFLCYLGLLVRLTEGRRGILQMKEAEEIGMLSGWEGQKVGSRRMVNFLSNFQAIFR